MVPRDTLALARANVTAKASFYFSSFLRGFKVSKISVFLFSFDIECFFTNVPVKEGIRVEELHSNNLVPKNLELKVFRDL